MEVWTTSDNPINWRLVHRTGNISALCPDLLRYEQIGEADHLRGRVVRGFFWLMRWWPV